ncbi:MAG: PEP-CTERM sorting domain-containing protein [Planctomycetota bacterium]
MNRSFQNLALTLPLAFLLAFAFAAQPASAATVWTGPSIVFTKAPFADFNLPENQDRITDAVWLTRGNSQGLYNAAQEASYNQLFSTAPEDTQWATGTTADLPNLTFTTWRTWAGTNTGGGLDVVNRPSVVHLISDDVFIDIEFLSWSAGGTAGGQGGGGFSYVRSTNVPEPATLVLMFASLAAYGFRRRR